MDARPDRRPALQADETTAARAHDALRADALRAGALDVVERLRGAGFEALWAGGCVRDLVLGLAPKDYDVATSATPQQVIALFDKSVPVGVAFGVVRVIVPAGEYEVATFRSDFAYVDGRRPTGVTWTGAREDALRRDFTINGLFQDPLGDGGAGVIIDHVGGQADIRARIIRAIGDARARFSEDYLRLIRGVRFAARFGFHIEAETMQAIVIMAPNIMRVSVERIFEEMDKILSQGDAARGVTLLEASGLLQHILPEVDPVRAEHRLQALCVRRREQAPGRMAAWGALVSDLDGATIQAIALRLKASRDFQRALVELTMIVKRLSDWGALGVADRKRLARLATFDDALDVAEAAGVDVDLPRAIAWSASELRPAPLVSGDALAARGHRPGPAFKAALEAVETAQLEGRVHDVDQALALAEAELTRDARARDR